MSKTRGIIKRIYAECSRQANTASKYLWELFKNVKSEAKEKTDAFLSAGEWHNTLER